ncbi:MAG: Gfo/Idh/MocA family protein [Candidatus Pelagibacter sp.]|tara:strand:+ start:360 stop:1439 length:1080 start_codon:yes stop_codon:yes gene_type:complete
MKKYQVAIIGTNIGAKHFEDFKKVSERFNVHTLCGLTRGAIDKILQSNTETKVSLNFDNVLKVKEIDIIDICLPPHLHFSACKKAMIAGKHVICEKPLVSSLKEVDELEKISKETGKIIFPVFQYRYGLGFSKLKALIKSGLAGNPLVASLETHWNRGKDYYSKPWRGTWEGEQGGAILSHSIHIHDLVSMILGPVSNVFSKLTTRVNDIEVEDCAALSIEMENGTLVTSSITLGAANDTSRLRFCFEGLTAESGASPDKPYSPADDKWDFLPRAPITQTQIVEVLSKVKEPKSWYAGMFEEIANKLDGSSSDEVTLLDARKSLEFVTAVYDSSRKNKSIKLPINKDNPLYNSWLPLNN